MTHCHPQALSGAKKVRLIQPVQKPVTRLPIPADTFWAYSGLGAKSTRYAFFPSCDRVQSCGVSGSQGAGQNGGGSQGPDGRGSRNLAAARGGAGRRLRAVRLRDLVVLSWQNCANGFAAEAGAGRLLPWVPVAFGVGIAFYFAAGHETGRMGHRGRGGLVLRRGVSVAAAKAVCRRRYDRRDRRGLCDRDRGGPRESRHGVLARPIYSVSLSGFVETRDIRERTDRFVLPVATTGEPRALGISSGARPALG